MRACPVVTMADWFFYQQFDFDLCKLVYLVPSFKPWSYDKCTVDVMEDPESEHEVIASVILNLYTV